MSTKGFHQKLCVFERFHFGLGGSKEPPEPPTRSAPGPEGWPILSNLIIAGLYSDKHLCTLCKDLCVSL